MPKAKPIFSVGHLEDYFLLRHPAKDMLLLVPRHLMEFMEQHLAVPGPDIVENPLEALKGRMHTMHTHLRLSHDGKVRWMLDGWEEAQCDRS